MPVLGCRCRIRPRPAEIIPFDTGWRFCLGDDPAARQPDFDDKNWRTLDLPHDWSIEGPVAKPPEGEGNGGFFTHGIGWYRKSFTLRPTAGRKVVIEFDGVYMNSEVWINGQFLGRRPYGFMGFRYDLTQYLKTHGSPNVLAVRVDDSLEPSLRWYAGSGIYRHVRLIATELHALPPQRRRHRHHAGSRAREGHRPGRATSSTRNFFSDAERAAWAQEHLEARNPTTREVLLRSSVLDADGDGGRQPRSRKSSSAACSPARRATQSVTVPKPRLWSDTTPELYRLRSTLTLDGSRSGRNHHHLRHPPPRVPIPTAGLFVNGKPTKLKGVCIHQDAGSFGNAVPAAVWALRLAASEGDGLQRRPHQPSSLRAGVLRPVRPARHLRLR